MIIPLYNKADTVLRTLASVEAQAFRDFEVILVDDGSTDDGVAVIRNSRFAGLCRILSQPNKGVSAARNAGAALANGGYLCFLDADDEWLPPYLQKMFDLIRRFPGAGLYGANYTRPGSKRYRGLRADGYCDLFREAIIKMPFHMAGVIIPKPVYLAHRGFDERLSYYEDHHLFFRIALQHEVAVCRELLTVYHFDSKESANSKKRDFSVALYPYHFVVEKALSDGDQRPSIQRYARWTMRHLLAYSIRKGRRGDDRCVRQAFSRMCRCVPELSLYRDNKAGAIFCFFVLKYFGLRFRLARLGLG